MKTRMLLAVLILAGLSKSVAAAEKNVVLFVSDDHGYQAGCYGDPVVKTPSLDSLAADGTRFDLAFCTSASCSASRAELAEYYQSISRMDQGLGRVMKILKESGHWDDTLVIYVSDNGTAFPGAKTTCYEPGLRLPCVVRNPYLDKRGLATRAMVNWADIAPTILDFAGAMPEKPAFHGRSFLSVLDQEDPDGWDETYASHTFHEIQMYYPMRVVRGERYKLIWNIAHGLPYPFASDLWEAPTFQDRYKQGLDTLYGKRTIRNYIHRPAFELYDLESDPDEIHNLADDPQHANVLAEMKAKLKAFQKRTDDPWIMKWEYE